MVFYRQAILRSWFLTLIGLTIIWPFASAVLPRPFNEFKIYNDCLYVWNATVALGEVRIDICSPDHLLYIQEVTVFHAPNQCVPGTSGTDETPEFQDMCTRFILPAEYQKYGGWTTRADLTLPIMTDCGPPGPPSPPGPPIKANAVRIHYICIDETKEERVDMCLPQENLIVTPTDQHVLTTIVGTPDPTKELTCVCDFVPEQDSNAKNISMRLIYADLQGEQGGDCLDYLSVEGSLGQDTFSPPYVCGEQRRLHEIPTIHGSSLHLELHSNGDGIDADGIYFGMMLPAGASVTINCYAELLGSTPATLLPPTNPMSPVTPITPRSSTGTTTSSPAPTTAKPSTTGPASPVPGVPTRSTTSAPSIGGPTDTGPAFTPPPPPSPQSQGLSSEVIGIIVGCILGGFLIVGIIAGIAIYARRNRDKPPGNIELSQSKGYNHRPPSHLSLNTHSPAQGHDNGGLTGSNAPTLLKRPTGARNSNTYSYIGSGGSNNEGGYYTYIDPKAHSESAPNRHSNMGSHSAGPEYMEPLPASTGPTANISEPRTNRHAANSIISTGSTYVDPAQSLGGKPAGIPPSLPGPQNPNSGGNEGDGYEPIEPMTEEQEHIYEELNLKENEPVTHL